MVLSFLVNVCYLFTVKSFRALGETSTRWMGTKRPATHTAHKPWREGDQKTSRRGDYARHCLDSSRLTGGQPKLRGTGGPVMFVLDARGRSSARTGDWPQRLEGVEDPPDPGPAPRSTRSEGALGATRRAASAAGAADRRGDPDSRLTIQGRAPIQAQKFRGSV